MWRTTVEQLLGRPIVVTFKPKYKIGHVLEISEEAKPEHMDYRPLFTMILGREARYVKIIGIHSERMHYAVKLFDKNMSVLEGSSHLLPYIFVDNLFRPHVAHSMEGIAKAKGLK